MKKLACIVSIRSISISSILCTALVLPMQAEAQWLRPAHPLEPLAFTWPAVRDVSDRIRVQRNRVVKRAHAHRRDYSHRPSYKRVHVSRSYRVREAVHGYPLTGWKPLPYEFGPWNSSVVVLRH
jgi:hypothetical protein